MTDLIADYQKHLERRRRSANTIKLYIGVLRRMDAELAEGLPLAVAAEIEDWIFGEPRSDATYSLYVTIAQGFGKWATDPRRPRLSRNEAAFLDSVTAPRGLPKPVPETDLADILARSRDPHLLRIQLAAFGGLRCCEIAHLDRAMVTEREIKVFGKGSKWRTVPTHPLIWARVRDLPDGPVAGNVDGSRATAEQVSRRGASHLRRLGYAHSLHAFRHRFATATYESCRDIVVVQELLGHDDPKTTRRYVEVNRDRQAAAVRGLPVAS